MYSQIYFSSSKPAKLYVSGTKGIATPTKNRSFSTLHPPSAPLQSDVKILINPDKPTEIPPLHKAVISWENVEENTSITNVTTYKADFYRLIEFYANKIDNYDFAPLAAFVKKYGSPFDFVGTTSISIDDFYSMIYSIRSFQSWQFNKETIDKLMQALKTATSLTPNDKVYVRFISQTVADELKRLGYKVYISSDFSFIYGTEFTSDTTSNIPDSLLVVKEDDLPSTNHLQWLKNNLLKNLAPILQNSISVKLTTDSDFLCADLIVNNQILFYLFEILYKPHTTCKKCGALLEIRQNHKRDYCNDSCRLPHFKKHNPKAKLSNLESTWKANKVFDSKTHNLKFKQAEEMLKTSEYKIVLEWLQSERSKYRENNGCHPRKTIRKVNHNA